MSVITDLFEKVPQTDAQMWMEARSHAEEEYERLRREIERLEEELEQIRKADASLMEEECDWDKQFKLHCTCVPGFRRNIERLEAENKRLLFALQEVIVTCNVAMEEVKP